MCDVFDSDRIAQVHGVCDDELRRFDVCSQLLGEGRFHSVEGELELESISYTRRTNDVLDERQAQFGSSSRHREETNPKHVASPAMDVVVPGHHR